MPRSSMPSISITCSNGLASTARSMIEEKSRSAIRSSASTTRLHVCVEIAHDHRRVTRRELVDRLHLKLHPAGAAARVSAPVPSNPESGGTLSRLRLERPGPTQRSRARQAEMRGGTLRSRGERRPVRPRPSALRQLADPLSVPLLVAAPPASPLSDPGAIPGGLTGAEAVPLLQVRPVGCAYTGDVDALAR